VANHAVVGKFNVHRHPPVAAAGDGRPSSSSTIFVPTGQPDNSPAFQRRNIIGTGTSPAGTAEQKNDFASGQLFHL
jgi:hypothetical protein